MPDDTGYYVRHALFPRIITEIYGDSCAVCALSPHTGSGSGLVDAAHILPFAEFHNDDPRNGIAFCKNHHWGFDAGWFGITDEYHIFVSPQLHNGLSYITAGVSLRLPENPDYAPALSALAWHRNSIYRK